MIGVTVYIGGEIINGPHGSEYSINPRFMFSARPEMNFKDLTDIIYQRLGLDENQYELSITSRINIAMPGQTYFFNWFRSLMTIAGN